MMGGEGRWSPVGEVVRKLGGWDHPGQQGRRERSTGGRRPGPEGP